MDDNPLSNPQQVNAILSMLKEEGAKGGFDFSAASIIAYLLFGIIGFAAFMYGKKQNKFKPLLIGIALMVYPYFIGGAWGLYGVGILLTVCLYFFRE